MEINVLIDQDFEAYLEAGWLEGVARQVLTAEPASPDAELSLVITGQERVRQLNRDYLNRDRPTDVLAFSMLAGLPVESALLVIHGILHLLGYDDEKPEEKRRMRAREREILSAIKVD